MADITKIQLAIGFLLFLSCSTLTGQEKEKYYHELQTHYLSFSDGIHTSYFNNGNKKVQCTVKNGLLNGPYLDYFKNGNLRGVDSFKNGQFHGTSIRYNKKGKPLYKKKYINNKLIYEYVFSYYSNGAIKKKWYIERTDSNKIYSTSEVPVKSVRPLKKFSFEELGYKYYFYPSKVNGYYTGYYKNGKIKQTGKLNNGEKTGEWITYSKDRKIIKRKRY